MNDPSFLSAGRRPSSWLVVPAIVGIGAASLSIHVTMLQILRVPYPVLAGIGRWGLALVLLRVLALIIVYRLALPSLVRLPLLARIACVALLETMIAGNIRAAIMEAVVTEDVAFPSISLAWNLVRSLVLAALVVGAQRILRPAWAAPMAAIAITIAMTLVIDPIGRASVALFAELQRPEVHAEPYGAWVLSWSYAAFVETVAATLVVASLVAPRLSPRPAPAVFQFVVLILLLRGTLVMQLLFPWFMPSGFAAGSLSTSQFFLQDLVMTLLVWCLWRTAWPADGTRSSGRDVRHRIMEA